MLGVKQDISDDSLFYWGSAAVVSLLAYVAVITSVIRRRELRAIELFLYAIPIVYVWLFLAAQNYSGLAVTSITLYLLYVVPSCLIAIELGRSAALPRYSKHLLAIGISITIGISFSLPVALATAVSDLTEFFAGGHYQSFSYFSGLAFLFCLNHLSQNWKVSTRAAKLFLMSLMAVQLTAIVVSGGRGGFVVAALGILVFLWMQIRFGWIAKVLAIVALGAVVVFAVTKAQTSAVFSERTTASLGRLFSYIVEGGLDFSNASNRDLYYSQAVAYISQKPITGYGVFSVIEHSPDGFFGAAGNFYAHNIVLDILLHGGVIYFSFFMIVLLIFVTRLKGILQRDPRQSVVLVPVIYSFVLLSFSGTYLQEPLFWFSFYYVFSYRHVAPSAITAVTREEISSKLVRSSSRGSWRLAPSVRYGRQ